MNIENQTELFAIRHQLSDLVAQEQDDAANGFLVDAWEAIGAALDRLNKKANEEFQDDTPSNAPKIPWNCR